MLASSQTAILAGFYDYRLVSLSVVIAVFSSYVALDLAGRITSARGTSRFAWLSCGATAMGIGIWSMHYLGMLAFRLPILVRYDWPTVLGSLVAAIFASAVALFVVSRRTMGLGRAFLGSVAMGSGIAAMHYIGMAAMRMPAMCHYSVALVGVSIALAIGISFVALWLAYRFRTETQMWSWRKAISALVMGSAIPVMHYTGMAAASFVPMAFSTQQFSHAISVSSLETAGISVGTLMILGMVLLTSLGLDSVSDTRQLATRYFLSLSLISFLAILSTVLVQYQGHEATVSDLRKSHLQLGLLLSIVMGLLLQGLLVLRPALQRIQKLITSQELAQQRLQRKATFVELLQVVAVAANEATSVDEALQFTLDQICDHTGSPVGHVYLCGPRSKWELVSSNLWHFDNPSKFQSFREITVSTRLKLGTGLAGRVVVNRHPVWIPDISQDPSFPRRAEVLNLGMKGAFGFPVVSHGEVVAVLEFLSTKIESADGELLRVMGHVGEQLGQLMERKAAEEELVRRAEELQRSNAELEVFAYVASHDLQEPLRMVASYTQLLARRYRGKLDADADEFIGFAVDGATRMQGLIQDLLCYSRVTTRGQELQSTEAKAACESALQNLRGAIEESNALISVGPLPNVMADATQFTQLFQNLIGNALKYRNETRPEIQVSARPKGEDWVISVHDNGIGIEPQYFERIFQMFQRLHTRKDYAGTGIGLAVCRKIVERHGGRIWVESQPGKGSTFLFTIPQAEKKENQFHEFADDRDPARRGQPRGRAAHA